MSLHTEIRFEDDICDDLTRDGWFYDQTDAAKYEPLLCGM